MTDKNILERGDFRYAWRRWGDPQAPAVVLLMGLGLSMDAWPEGIISGLLAEGFQVITPDNRDSGDSSRMEAWVTDRRDVVRAIVRTLLGLRVTGEYALEDMALDLERLLDALGIRRAHVAGISMGGMIAQVFACQCPNRVATLTSISSAVGNPRTGLGRLRAVATVAGGGSDSSPAGVERHIRRMLKALSGPKYRPSEAELDEAVRSAPRLGFDGAATRRQLIALLASGNRRAAVKQLTTPTLVIHGKADPLLPFKAGEETARLVKGAKLIAVDGLGHQLPPQLMGQYARWIAAHCHAHPA
ncbi:alpha/beta fold hydrolase [Sutterella sp.]|uniref:alpha/beta fold hydrolase n=1 Tax=Sutterella sp. TaxID=1981025 RepID=UPI0026E04AF9|nr:alpha/beta hydrolase [Sutterella sp.]MDO5530391.1 alpha/beta hydrolase [Sutterella sp.]